jgi:phosphoglycerate dehydrogenase-like enzyme
MTRVLIGWHANEEELAIAREALPAGVEIVTVPEHEVVGHWDCDGKVLAESVKDADVLLTWTIDRPVYKNMQNLKLLAWSHSGFDPIDLNALASHNVQMSNAAGGNAIAVAEQAFAFLLALSKRVVERDQRVKNGRWIPIWESDRTSTLLEGGTVAIIGMGAIGRRVARYSRAFDLRVIGVRRSGEPSPDADVSYGPDGLLTALAEADYVVLAVPHTPETEAYFGTAELNAMKKGSYLINICRGRVVHEVALRKALDSGHLGGYASDVWWSYSSTIPEGWHYSVPSRMGVHQMDQVVASHDSACDILAVNRTMFDRSLMNVRVFLEGGTPPNLVFDGKKRVGSLAGMPLDNS